MENKTVKVNNFGKSLGHYLTVHAAELNKIAKKADLIAFLENIPEDQLSTEAKEYRSAAIQNIQKLSDKKALLYVWDIFLKGENLGVC